jgi:hypothetical protein
VDPTGSCAPSQTIAIARRPQNDLVSKGLYEFLDVRPLFFCFLIYDFATYKNEKRKRVQ